MANQNDELAERIRARRTTKEQEGAGAVGGGEAGGGPAVRNAAFTDGYGPPLVKQEVLPLPPDALKQRMAAHRAAQTDAHAPAPKPYQDLGSACPKPDGPTLSRKRKM